MVDSGELEVGGAHIVEDEVGVGAPSTGRLLEADIGGQLVVDGQRAVDGEDSGCVATQTSGGDVQGATRDVPDPVVDGNLRERAVVEVRGAEHVLLAAGEVARLRVCGGTALVLPQAVVLLGDQTDLAIRLTVAVGIRTALVGCARTVGALRRRECVEELEQGRWHLAGDCGHPEGSERHEVAVELTDPVDEPVTAGVADEDVTPGTAIGAVLIEGVGVRSVVEPGDAAGGARAVGRLAQAARGEVVVGLEEIVAPATPQGVVSGAADDPVVAQVAEQHVGAVTLCRTGRHAGSVGGHGDAADAGRSLVGHVVEEEGEREGSEVGAPGAGVPARGVGRAAPGVGCRVEEDGPAGVVLVVEVELPRPAGAVVVPAVDVVGVPAQDVSGIVRVPEVDPHQTVAHGGAVGDRPCPAGRDVVRCVASHEGLSTGHGVITRAAVDGVIAETAEDDVVVAALRSEQGVQAGGVDVERREVDSLVEDARHVDRLLLHVAGGVDDLAEDVAFDGARVRVVREKREYAVERLGVARGPVGTAAKALGGPPARAVAAGGDAPVITEDAVVTGAAGDPVVAVAADEVIVLAVAIDDVVAGHAVDLVVTGLAVDLVAGTAVSGCCGGVEGRPAERVVEHLHGARDKSQPTRIRVVGVGEIGVGVLLRAVRSDEAQDACVVTRDDVGVTRVSRGDGGDDAGRADGGVTDVVARKVGASATEDQVGPGRAALGSEAEGADGPPVDGGREADAASDDRDGDLQWLLESGAVDRDGLDTGREVGGPSGEQQRLAVGGQTDHAPGHGLARGVLEEGRGTHDSCGEGDPLVVAQTIEVGGVADDVVLTEVAEDRVGTTVAFDVVITVGGQLH